MRENRQSSVKRYAVSAGMKSVIYLPFARTGGALVLPLNM